MTLKAGKTRQGTPYPDEDDDLENEYEPSGKSSDDDLFDDALGYDDDTGVRPAKGLTEQEKRQATTLWRLFNELWGICIIVGEPGAGKDTFGNWLAFTLKRYFPQKKTLRDERPRRSFGKYAGLFNESVIQEDLSKMREIAKGVGATKTREVMEQAADKWVTSKGEVLLQNSVLYLTEFWKYCYKRDPMNPMNLTMGGIHKVKRHLNTFIIGTVQMADDLDKFTCKPFIDWRTTCLRSKADSTRYSFIVEKVKYDRRLDLLVPQGKAMSIPVDAGRPRSFIGDGRIVVKRPDYQPESDEERIVLDVLKAGVDTYEGLVDAIDEYGDMSEWEILDTLKRLSLKLPGKRGKFVVDYPCYYKIFNSRSAPSMKTNVKSE